MNNDILIIIYRDNYEDMFRAMNELMKMVDFEKFHALSYSTSDRLYYWNFYKENTIFCLTDRGSTFTHIKHVREKGGKVFSCKGFEKRMKYFMYIDGKEGSTK